MWRGERGRDGSRRADAEDWIGLWVGLRLSPFRVPAGEWRALVLVPRCSQGGGFPGCVILPRWWWRGTRGGGVRLLGGLGLGGAESAELGGDHFVHAGEEVLGAEAEVVAGDHFDEGVGFEEFELGLDKFDGAFEIEVVGLTGGDVDFAGEFGGEGGPVCAEDVADVVAAPGFGDFGVNGAGVAVPEGHGLAIGAAGAEDGFEGAQLFAAQRAFHIGEQLKGVGGDVVHADEGAEGTVRIGEGVGLRCVNVDAAEVAKVDGIGGGGPDAAEGVGVGDLEPEA